eukprot:GHVN01105478.1.p1 GENE.GHVN01105478.1~~GHVN01105478.1.p1  ORF type:complete len:100 (+),score=14.82 GHVN01105478.1:481-780(+)
MRLCRSVGCVLIGVHTCLSPWVAVDAPIPHLNAPAHDAECKIRRTGRQTYEETDTQTYRRETHKTMQNRVYCVHVVSIWGASVSGVSVWDGSVWGECTG